MKKLRMKFFKEVSYFNKDEGAEVRFDGTRDKSRWHIDVSFANGYLPINDSSKIEERLVDYVSDVFGIVNIDGEEMYHFTIYEDGNITFTVVEDGDGNHVHYTRQGTFPSQLYICDYVIMLGVHEVTKPTQPELINMFQGFDIA
ncbi:hypothetical protein [Pseudobacillus badius]|uniref:hypothetical protein n=1 Tax=Bacillus badius TaxID=1455 RepID=UPI0007B3204B|nr:hypothetical protein [Bacillus badius]KZR57518.1 hypothetical protein A3781_19695 [Bacillus badius]